MKQEYAIILAVLIGFGGLAGFILLAQALAPIFGGDAFLAGTFLVYGVLFSILAYLPIMDRQ